MQSIDGGKPRPLTPEGIAFCNVAPEGTLLALTEDFRAQVYPPRQRHESAAGNSIEPRRSACWRDARYASSIWSKARSSHRVWFGRNWLQAGASCGNRCPRLSQYTDQS